MILLFSDKSKNKRLMKKIKKKFYIYRARILYFLATRISVCRARREENVFIYNNKHVICPVVEFESLEIILDLKVAAT